MNTISFKNLKFFKSSGTQGKKQKNGTPPAKKEKELNFWKKLGQNPFIFIFIFVLILAYFLSYLPSRSLRIPIEGEIADSDIAAPEDLTIEDKEMTEKKRAEAAEAVLPVYSYDPSVIKNTEKKIREFFNSGREWINERVTAKRIEEFQTDIKEKYGFEIFYKDLKPLEQNKFAVTVEENLINLIWKVSNPGIISSKTLFIRGEQERGLTLIRPEIEKILQIDNIQDMKESKEQLAEQIRLLDISKNEKAVLKTLSHFFLKENITYDMRETEARKKQESQSLDTVFYRIKKGKVILRKGDEVSKDALKTIRIINQNLRAKPSWLTNFSGTFLLFGLLFLSLWYYLKSQLKFKEALTNFIIMGIILILSLFFYKLSIFLSEIFSESSNISVFSIAESYKYAFPFQLGVLLFAFFPVSYLALIYAVLNSLLVGYLFKANFYLMVFSFTGGLAAIFGIKFYGKQSRTSAFRAGIFLVAPVNTFVIIVIHLIKEKMGPIDILTSELFMGILGGILSVSLAFLLLPVFEYFFGLPTQTKLLELTNTNLPIFKRMAREAHGSHQHSLRVADLAETAAEEIKLDPVLAKAAGYYHDIGKIKRPEYFIENQTRFPDMHKDLKPSMSTLVIVNHVKEGLEEAKKLRLPKKIKEIIEQHHGTSLVRYFFHKAKEKYDPEMQKIGEESYRYAGPIPKSKEAALIMLADSSEAAARSMKSHTITNLKKMISDIFNAYLKDGQLDECDLSMKELRAIASSFLSTLFTMLHPRVEYPGFDFEMKEKKGIKKNKNNNDRDYKSTAKVLGQSKDV